MLFRSVSQSRYQRTVVNDKSNVVLELRYKEVARLFIYDREAGVTGVYFSKSRNKFIAQIKVNRQVHYLGCYNTLEEAAAARVEANLKFNFHNNHGKGRAEYVRKKSIT